MVKKEKGSGRIRVFFAELEGDNETIQEGLKTVTLAVGKTFQSPPKIVNVIAPDDVSRTQLEVIDSVELEEEEENQIKPRNPKSKSRSSKPPNMSLVKDLDLRPKDKQSFRDFYEEKSPDSQQKSITIAVYYLDKIISLDNITADHIFTCLKDVSVKPPKNLPQTIRNISRRKGWIDIPDKGKIKITNSGENCIEFDLPPKT